MVPKRVEELLDDFYLRGGHLLRGEKLLFAGVDGYGPHNPTAPFKTEIFDQEIEVMAVRLEKRWEFINSQVKFFTSGQDGVWRPILGAPTFYLEDPFVTHIGGELIFGGVRVTNLEPLHFRAVFYRGKDIFSLKEFAQGPVDMKDIRLVALEGGRIGIFTRPQGKVGGKGKIGFTSVKRLEDINPVAITKAKLFKNLLLDTQWGGVTEAHLLVDGSLGVLSHVAYENSSAEGKLLARNYFASSFILNPKTGKISDFKIIATRANFPPGPAKAPDLSNVVFSGGLLRTSQGIVKLYVGLSDTEVGVITIPDPFVANLMARQFENSPLQLGSVRA